MNFFDRFLHYSTLIYIGYLIIGIQVIIFLTNNSSIAFYLMFPNVLLFSLIFILIRKEKQQIQKIIDDSPFKIIGRR